MADFQRQQRVKTALDQYQLKLQGTKIDGAKGAPTLTVYHMKGHPRIDVWPNDPSDNEPGKPVRAEIDIRVLHQVEEMIELVHSTEGANSIYISNKGYVFNNGQRSDKPVEKSKLHVGKDEDGQLWIAIIAYGNRPKVRFPFKGRFYHGLMNADGTDLSPAKASIIEARSWVKAVIGLFTNQVAESYVEEDFFKKREGSANGGGNNNWNNNKQGGNNSWKQNNNNNNSWNKGSNNNGGNGGGGNSAPQKFDEDLPF